MAVGWSASRTGFPFTVVLINIDFRVGSEDCCGC